MYVYRTAYVPPFKATRKRPLVAKMRAIVHNKYGSLDLLELRDVDRPQVGDDDVLVRVTAASVNPFDLHMISGLPYLVRTQAGLFGPKNKIPGADLAGIVEAVGSNVDGFQQGDEVYGENRRTFAEYACVPPDKLALKPRNMSFEQAAAVPLAGLTALQGLRKGKIAAGQKVLINGASGGIGTFAVQIAKASGAEVTGVCSTRNTQMVASIGADHVIDYSQHDFTTDGSKYDLIFDLAASRSMSEYRRALQPDGTYVAGGSTKGRRPGTGPFSWMVKVLVASKRGSQDMVLVNTKVRRDDLVALAELAEAKKITSVIDRTYELADTADALRHLAEGHAQGKTVIAI